MSPKEKAKQLVDVYYNHSDLLFETLSFIQAKECALITIHELIRVTPWSGDYDNEIEDGSKEFYLKVKQEIEKL